MSMWVSLVRAINCTNLPVMFKQKAKKWGGNRHVPVSPPPLCLYWEGS